VDEAAHLLDTEPDWVAEHPTDALSSMVDRLGCAVALRGPVTYAAAPGTAHHLDTSGPHHLATAGSGDVLAGVAAGMATRSDDLLGVAVRAVRALASAGAVAADRAGGAILARDLLPVLARCVEDG
jgi:NAD(P)H-hydrate repair Nnr-like enzyme with NAD(P)H-hydrate dehydratase domain